MESLRTLSSLFFFVKPDSVSFELPKQIIGKREQTVKALKAIQFLNKMFTCAKLSVGHPMTFPLARCLDLFRITKSFAQSLFEIWCMYMS